MAAHTISLHHFRLVFTTFDSTAHKQTPGPTAMSKSTQSISPVQPKSFRFFSTPCLSLFSLLSVGAERAHHSLIFLVSRGKHSPQDQPSMGQSTNTAWACPITRAVVSGGWRSQEHLESTASMPQVRGIPLLLRRLGHCSAAISRPRPR